MVSKVFYIVKGKHIYYMVGWLAERARFPKVNFQISQPRDLHNS